ncbi:MAG: PQQ-binding-like beta-propeller repeat protein [Pirellulales bacterium]
MKRALASSLLLGFLFWVTSMLAADEWPQWRGPNRDGVWNETGIIEKFNDEQIRVSWRAEISSGYSAPSVAQGRVYVTDRLAEPEQSERVHCFDAASGKKLWMFHYPAPYTISYTAGPRAAPTVEDGRVFVLGAMAHFHCFDAATGDVLWKHDLNTEYKISKSRRMPIWGITSAPLVDGNLVILQIGGTDGACLVAFDKKTGKEQWRALDDKASYSAPIVIQQAGQPVLLCWTGDHLAGLNPQTGDVHWKHAFAANRMVINVPTPVVSANRIFLTSFYDGSEMLRLDADQLAVNRVWRRRGKSEKETDALHSMISTPVMLGDHVYGVDSYGELRCLDAATGDRVWEDLTATPKARWSNIHMVRNGDRIFMFNERGELLIGKLSPGGFQKISRAKLLAPTTDQLRRRDGVCWAHPAYAYKHVFARSDKELVCANLAAERE